jgi:hypothetical protein
MIGISVESLLIASATIRFDAIFMLPEFVSSHCNPHGSGGSKLFG